MDRSFLRLAAILGTQRLLQATVVLPTPEHFPDPYDSTELALQRIFERVAAGMQVNPSDKPHISINQKQLEDPMALVAVLAHELGHIILLRPGLVPRDDPDMEPRNDLLTVFLGFGIFTANAAFRFKQYTSDRSQGWSARRLGYLSEELFGYALARFALERGEVKPAWRKFLSTNISTYLKRSAAWLADRHEPRLLT